MAPNSCATASSVSVSTTNPRASSPAGSGGSAVNDEVGADEGERQREERIQQPTGRSRSRDVGVADVDALHSVRCQPSGQAATASHQHLGQLRVLGTGVAMRAWSWSQRARSLPSSPRSNLARPAEAGIAMLPTCLASDVRNAVAATWVDGVHEQWVNAASAVECRSKQFCPGESDAPPVEGADTADQPGAQTATFNPVEMIRAVQRQEHIAFA